MIGEHNYNGIGKLFHNERTAFVFNTSLPIRSFCVK